MTSRASAPHVRLAAALPRIPALRPDNSCYMFNHAAMTTGRDPLTDPSAPAAPPTALSRSTKAWIGVVLAGTAGMIVFLFVHLQSGGGIQPGAAPAHAECARGQPDCLPDLNYVDTTGVAYSRDALAGKIVLVNFWATWCRPCEKEIPDLSRMYDKYKAKGVAFLGVLVDNPDSQQLLNFQSDHDMSYPVVRASGELMAAYGAPDAYPTTFVYDRTGKQVYSHLGLLREREIDALLDGLVAQH
jgi:thiol-disulfide isomerase/thioredoxin